MYEAYWKLQRKPFSPATAADAYYPAEAHQGAQLKLRYAIENHQGAAVLAGPAGVGKSLLVQRLLRALPESLQPRTHLVFPHLPPDQWLAVLASELIPEHPLESSVGHSVIALRDFLQHNRQQDQHAVLVVDEAQLLNQHALWENLRLLLNFGSEGEPLLSLLLVGHPRFLAYLRRCPSLAEQVHVRCMIHPFTQEETVSYITHRLSAAGAEETIFDASAMEVIHELAQGIPRQINRLCDLALLVGYAEEKSLISAVEVAAVSEEIVSLSHDVVVGAR